jgi:hypothetical protein
LLLGPSFHSFTYLFAPALTLFVAARFVSLRPGLVSSLSIAGLFGVALLLAVAIASPKIAAWRVLEMKRPVTDPGALALAEGFRSLYDYTLTSWSWHETFVKDSPTPLRLLGTEETALALPPTATLLALLGLTALVRGKSKRLLALLSLCFIGLALSLACSVDIWSKVRELSGGNIRAAARFLALAGFGLSLLAALGADFLLERWRRAAPYVGAVFGVSILAAPLWWTHEAGQVAKRAREDTVRPEVMRPLATLKEERAKALALTSFSHLVGFQRGRREVLEGRGYKDGFQIVGNRFQQKLFKSRSRKMNRRPKAIAQGNVAPEDITIGHTSLQVRNLPAKGRVRLHVREPQLGFEVFPTSARSKVEVKFGKAGCFITNISNRKLRRVTLRPRFPISFGWFGMSAVALLGAGFVVTHKRKQPAPAAPSALNPNPEPANVENNELRKSEELRNEAHVTGLRP